MFTKFMGNVLENNFKVNSLYFFNCWLLWVFVFQDIMHKIKIKSYLNSYYIIFHSSFILRANIEILNNNPKIDNYATIVSFPPKTPTCLCR